VLRPGTSARPRRAKVTIRYQPGQGTGFHDHGGPAGAFAVALGELQEQVVRGNAARIREVAVRTITPGGVRC